jgi:tetratricopeptide (TPR) repeat protein
MSRLCRFCRAIVLLSTLLLPAVVSAQETTPSEELALEAYRQGASERAVELYTAALSETDDAAHRARIQVQIAWNLFTMGRPDEVRTHLRIALTEEPNLSLPSDYYTPEFLEIFEQARRSNYEAGAGDAAPAPDLEITVASINDRIISEADLEGALADVDRLMQAYPRDGRLIPLKAQILNLLGRTDEAAALSRARNGVIDSQIYDDSVSATDLVLRANRLLEQGDATTALQLSRQAVKLSPTNYMALELMAEAAQRVADWKSAEYALKSALSLQPDNIDLKLRLGEVYLATFEASAARDVFKALTEQYPNSDRPWASLGLLEARLGNTDRALEALAKAIHENSLLPEVQLANGELLLLRGDVADALVSLEAAANLLRNDPQVEARLGQAMLASGRAKEALAHLKTAVEGGFDKPDVQRSLALALALNGMYAESRRVIDATEADPSGDRDVVLGYLELQKGNFAGAEQTFAGIAEARPGDPATVNILAATIYPQERYDEAVELLERAHQIDAQSEVIAANLGKAKAAAAAEVLAANARDVRPQPQ